MIQLLQHYSLSDIFIFIVFLALAIKSLISFFEWAYNKVQGGFRKGYKVLNEKQLLENRLQRGASTMAELQKTQKKTDEMLEQLSKKIDILVQSDKDAIKSYITKQHHHFCNQIGWIDDFSLNCVEKRYDHYKDEGGNSFIKGFMEDLRALPKYPLSEKK